jgi:hypothetical protein
MSARLQRKDGDGADIKRRGIRHWRSMLGGSSKRRCRDRGRGLSLSTLVQRLSPCWRILVVELGEGIMKGLLLTLALTAGFGFTQLAFAQATVTATCKDGSSFSGKTRSGACRGHGGVQSWDTGGTAPAATAPAPTPSAASPTRPPAATTAAAGGGVGQVWVNTSSKVYHCPSDRYYGKTKQGAYMTEAAAKAAGDHPSHGKVCF